MFYILNGIIISILLLDKVVGFKEAWNRRDKIYLNFLLTVISILGMGYLMAQENDLEVQQIIENEKKMNIMEQKNIA